MKKVIRLTESDLTRIVKRVIKEQLTWANSVAPALNKTKDSIKNNSVELKKFQDWMDTRGKWVRQADGSFTKLNKGPGYGKFGQSTKAAFDKFGEQYHMQTSTKNMGSDQDQWFQSNGYTKVNGQWVKK